MNTRKMLAPTNLNLKFILPLSLLFMTVYLAADSVIYKITSFHNVTLPGPPFIFPLSYVLGAIISEVYGSNISKQLIWFTLCCQLIYALMVTFVINLPCSNIATDICKSYNMVFSGLIHFVLSGTLAVLSSSFLNIYLIAKSKVLLNGKYFCLRNIISTASGGFLLVFIIVILVYLPNIGVKNSIHIFFSIYIFEFLYTTILVLPSWFICGFLKKYEKIDVFDYNVVFNPFRFTTREV